MLYRVYNNWKPIIKASYPHAKINVITIKDNHNTEGPLYSQDVPFYTHSDLSSKNKCQEAIHKTIDLAIIA